VEHIKSPETGVSALLRRAAANRSDDNLSAQIVYVDALPDGNDNEFFRKLTELPFPPPLQPGMVLDGYKILREIHASKRTQIYLALDSRTDQRVILKTPSVNYDDDASYIDQFLHEEWAGRRINSVHTLKILEPQERRQCLYYVTEYIEGQTLRQWMRDHSEPSLKEVRAIVEQVAQGLRAMHRMEMIHQDLKPENIMIDNHGLVKIIDFGSTKIAGIQEIISPLVRDNILGTRNYTAPEYLKNYAGSNRSDIFSLGVIAYEMLCGQLPYDKELSTRNLNKMRYQSVIRAGAAVPDWVDAALRKAVALNPERRYNLLSELVHDLSHPNPEFSREHRAPLIERNPLAFWRAVALFFMLTTLVALLK
jgi:serine/threonine protein kinase